jgi:hypothetical protein
MLDDEKPPIPGRNGVFGATGTPIDDYPLPPTVGIDYAAPWRLTTPEKELP